jgi:hypothetical protein
MVSPRRHEFQQSKDVCGKTIRQVLAKRRFYLDLKSRSVQTTNQLVQDVIALGGVIEEFFSSEVTTLVSDAPEWKLINTSDRDQANTIEQTTTK